MAGFGGITIPNLTPPSPCARFGTSTSDISNFEQQMFQFATEVSAITTAINSMGNVLKDAASKVAQ